MAFQTPFTRWATSRDAGAHYGEFHDFDPLIWLREKEKGDASASPFLFEVK
jgi:hypothetical protein